MEKHPIQQTVQSKTEWSNGNIVTLLSLLNFEVQEPSFEWLLTDILSLDQNKFRYSISEFLNKPTIFRYNGYQSIIAEEYLDNQGWSSDHFCLEDIDDVKDAMEICRRKEPSRSKNGANYRSFFSLEGYHVIRRETSATDLELLEEHGILPRRKYSVDVHLKIAKLVSEGMSPKEIVEYLREKHSSLKRAHISESTISSSTEVLGRALSNNFILHPVLQGDYSILVDSTTANRGGMTLLVIQAVAKNTEDDETFPGKIPLYAKYVSSENGEEVTSILKDFRAKVLAAQSVLDEFGIRDTKLPQEPIAVVTDFARQMLPMVDRVWINCNMVKQGCHQHFEGIIGRILIEPVYKELRKNCSQLLSSLRYYAKKHHFRHKTTKFEAIMAEVIRYYVTEKSYGRFGENLVNTLEKLYIFRRRIVHLLEELEAGKIQPHTGHGRFVKKMGEILVDHNFRETNKLARAVKQRLQFYRSLSKCLGTTYDSREEARNALLKVSESWKLNAEILDIEDLGKAANKIEEYRNVLIPAMHDPRIPRTTSILEGVHGQIKKILRQWGGRSETPSTFNWGASALTLLLGYDVDDDIRKKLEVEQPVDQWAKLNLEFAISPSNWVKSSRIVTESHSLKREILELSRPFKEATSATGFVAAFDRLFEETRP